MIKALKKAISILLIGGLLLTGELGVAFAESEPPVSDNNHAVSALQASENSSESNEQEAASETSSEPAGEDPQENEPASGSLPEEEEAPETGGEPEPETGGETEPEPETGGEPEPEAGSETGPEAGSETEPETGGETEPDAENTEEDLETEEEGELPVYPDPHYSEEIPDDFAPPFSGNTELSGQGLDAGYPASYDSRSIGAITAVRNQAPYELCWAFSALAVGESFLIRSGQTGAGVDLSEMHLGAFFSGDAYDPLGNTAGDGTYLEESYLTSGNNNKFTSFALANWIGAADEASYPYSNTAGWSPDRATDDLVHLSSFYWINAQDRESIKHYVIANGSVGISIYYKPEYLNTAAMSFYNPDYTATNHAVAIVGWDDAYPAENFGTAPEGDGAWLIRNSVGTDFGLDGYFWLSYYDAAICQASATAFVFEFEPASRYDFNYHYDGAYGTQWDSLSSGGELAAVFTAAGNAEKDELIEAVGIALASADVEYEIQIYTNLSDPADPASGIPAFQVPQTGSTALAGYYSVPLDSPVTVGSGERFSVVIRLRSNTQTVGFFADRSYSGSGWIRFVSQAEAGQTFRRQSGTDWEDLSSLSETARIKAYTVRTDSRKLRSLQFSDSSVLLNPDMSYRQLPLPSPADAQAYTLDWQSSDSAVATVDETGMVTPVSCGSCSIIASALEGSISASYTVEVKPRVNSILLRSIKTDMAPGEIFSPAADILPSSSAPWYDVVWSSSDETVAVVRDGQITALACGRTVIQASAGGKSRSYSLTVKQSLADAEVQLEALPFTGQPASCLVTVLLDGVELRQGEDYELRYRNNEKPGTGEVIIKGIELFSGELVREFPIEIQAPVLASAENTAKGIMLTWEAVDGASGYAVYRSKNEGKWTRIKKLSRKSAVSFVDSGAGTAGARYDYRITAVVAVSKKNYESSASVPVSTLRVPRVSLSSVAKTDPGLCLRWKPIRTADGYQIYRSCDDGEACLVYTVNDPAMNFWEDPDTESGRKYTYFMKAYALAGEIAHPGAKSGEKSFCIPAAPEELVLSNAASGIRLSWSPVDYAAAYRIFRSQSNGSWRQVKTVKSGVLTWTDAKAGRSGAEYAYRIIAVSSKNCGSCPGEASDAELICRLKKPVLRTFKLQDNLVTLSVSPVPGADGYVLFRQKDLNEAEPLLTVETDTAPVFQDQDLSADTEYGYWVCAFKRTERGLDYSCPSSARHVLVPAPVEITALSNEAKGIRIEWETEPHADGYTLYRRKNSGKWTRLKTLSSSAATFLDRGATSAGAAYSYRIQAYAKRDKLVFSSSMSQEQTCVR